MIEWNAIQHACAAWVRQSLPCVSLTIYTARLSVLWVWHEMPM